MAVANLITHTGKAKGEVELPAGAFDVEPNTHVMWEAVRNYRANQRQGTASVKHRSEMRGGGRKPWRQKGTGRARSGTNRSPIWVGGARAFGPRPRDYSYALPKKVKRLALRSALSTKARAGEVTVVSDFRLPEPRTREVAGILKNLDLSRTKCLLVVGEHDGDLVRAARNIPSLKTLEYRLLNTYQVLHADRLLIMESAVARIGEAWELMKLEPRMIIRRALITEKGARLREQGKVGNHYLFEVHPDANKMQIAHAIKTVFGVDVVQVRTMNYLGKAKRMGRFEGRRSAWKKAVVTLKPGQTVDIFDEV